MKKIIRLVYHGYDFPCGYSLYLNSHYSGYIVPVLGGFEAHFNSGMVLFSPSFLTLLRMAVCYG